MRILIIMSGFFPGKKYGGPPVSVKNFCALMKGIAECYIITHNHEIGERTPYSNIKEGWNNRDNAQVKYVGDENYNSITFESVIKEVKPDYIYLQGLFQSCVFPCLKLAKKYHIKVVLAPRGELCAGAFKKKYKKLPYIVVLRMMGLLKDVVFQSTSDDETNAIRKYLIVPKEKIHLLANIPSIPKDLPEHPEKIPGEGRFVFISRILWKKNLLNAIKYFNRIQGKAVFDVYGPQEDEDYWEECEEAIKQLPSNVIANYRGVLSHDEIHKTFRKYDAFLFPTLSENYGHVIAEALVTGCIPIISDQTPWTDINDAGAGWALGLKDEDGFKYAIQDVVELNEDEIHKKRDAINRYLQKKLRLNELKDNYSKIFNS